MARILARGGDGKKAIFELDRRSVLHWAERGGGAGEGLARAQDKCVAEVAIGRGGIGEVFLVTDPDLRR